MTVFRIISSLVIAALLGAVAFDLRRREKTWTAVWKFLRHGNSHTRSPLGMEPGPWRERLRRITYAASGAFFLFLAVTGFLPVLFWGGHLSGILLVIHVTLAPFFALSLSALALVWVHQLRFDEADWRTAQGLGRGKSPGEEALLTVALKAGFWMILLLSLPLMLTIILGLFPIFGTDGEALLIRLHGYSALLLLLASLGEIYLSIAYIDRNILRSTRRERPLP